MYLLVKDKILIKSLVTKKNHRIFLIFVKEINLAKLNTNKKLMIGDNSQNPPLLNDKLTYFK